MSCVATLREKGLKLTPQRILITDIIHDAKGHLSASDIIVKVQAKMPGVNKSTIYRTLDILEAAGCVYKSALGDDFIYHHTEEGHHHHLLCSECGKTIDCGENLFAPVQKSLKDKLDFHADFKHVVISGVCGECKNKRN